MWGSAEFYCACLNLTLPKYSVPRSSNTINIHARGSYRFPLISQILWNFRFHKSKEKENLIRWLSFEAEPINMIMFSHHALPSPPTWHFVSLKLLWWIIGHFTGICWYMKILGTSIVFIYVCMCVCLYIHTHKIMNTESFLDGNIQHLPEEVNRGVGRGTKENVKL